MSRKLMLMMLILTSLTMIALVSRIVFSQSLTCKQYSIPQPEPVDYVDANTGTWSVTFAEAVHNLDSGLNYTTIQGAIDANETDDGHTILVESGTYYENVNITKSISLIGEDRSTTIIYYVGTGAVINITKNNVNVTGFKIQSGWIAAGFYLNNANRCNITGNIMAYNLYGVYLVRSFNNTISRNTVTENHDVGISLNSSSANDIFGNNITNNEYGSGVYLFNSLENTISRNNITNNSIGVRLKDASNNNVSGNTVTDNWTGISLTSSFNNTISANTVTANSGCGVSLGGSNNTVYGNTIAANDDFGIYLPVSSNNIISGNDITNNYVNGIRLADTSSNRLYHNNIIDNVQQVFIEYVGHGNLWDNNVEGNYWSNYDGTDADNDGIGDSWCQIDENNIDHYPLMGMFSSFNTSLGYHVDVMSNSTLENFEYLESNGTIVIYLSGEGFGFCRVCISHDLMNEPYSVIINGTDVLPYHVDCELYDNGTHRWIYFTYKHSILEVVIVPEFPSFLIPPIFMTATLLVAIIHRKRLLCDNN